MSFFLDREEHQKFLKLATSEEYRQEARKANINFKITIGENMGLERNLRVKVQECEDLKEQLGAAEEANFIGDRMAEDLRAEVQELRKHETIFSRGSMKL